jgi:hypothetical protein
MLAGLRKRSFAYAPPGIPDTSARSLPLIPMPNPTPSAYRRGMTPRHSALRPHCFAHERLLLWTPINSRSPRDPALSLPHRQILSTSLTS